MTSGKSYVYVITHRASRRHYVGKTNDPAARWRSHLYSARGQKRRGFLLASAMRKYGPAAFSFVVVEEHESEEDAYEAERFWVEFLRSDVRGCGFNLESGGLGGKRMSATTRAKLAARWAPIKRATRLRREREKAQRSAAAESARRDKLFGWVFGGEVHGRP